jgi:toxin ParE1/3/4
MPEYFLSSKAEADITELLFYILEDNPDAAFALELRLFNVFDLLAENPYAGRERPELTEGTRSSGAGNYVIIYRLWAGEVAIIRVIHGARDLSEMFHEGKE